MFDEIKKAIEKFGIYSEDQLALITQRLKYDKIIKGKCLISEGDICRKFFFVKKGGFRHYKLSEDGTEATLNLFVDGDWIIEYKSFMAQKPSETVIEATDNSEIFELSVQSFHELMKISDEFFRLGSVFEQSTQIQRYQDNSNSPDEKYRLLLAYKPKVIQRFPLKHIASYLSMTPETLSRARRKLIS